MRYLTPSLARSKKACQQQGASLLFTACMMIMMTFMFVMVANIAQVMYDRIRLQQTLDEATLAAANIQAIGLNEIADYNRAAEEEYYNAQIVLGSVTWFDSNMAHAVVSYFEAIFETLIEYREYANEIYAVLAHDYANAVISETMPEEYHAGLLHFGPVDGASIETLTDFEEFYAPVRYRYYTSWCKWCFRPVAFAGSFGDTRHISEDRRLHSVIWGGAPRKRSRPDEFWPMMAWIKDPERVTYAAYSLSLHRDKYLLGHGVFSDAYPEMTVYSSAKPSGGSLYPYITEYVSLLKELDRHNPLPAVPALERMQH